MSEFDELFNSIQTSNIVDIIRDSRIELVSELDEPSLKTGEYFYDDKTNTLYVGAGQLMENQVPQMSWMIKAWGSAVLHPAPRIKSTMLVDLSKVIITASGKSRGSNHYYFTTAHTVNVPVISHPTSARRVPVLSAIVLNHTINVPIVAIESEVNYGE